MEKSDTTGNNEKKKECDNFGWKFKIKIGYNSMCFLKILKYHCFEFVDMICRSNNENPTERFKAIFLNNYIYSYLAICSKISSFLLSRKTLSEMIYSIMK